MNPEQHVLISLLPGHAANILDGTKTVELRRRSMGIEPGSIVWLYVKAPVASIVGFAVAKQVHRLTPSAIWDRFGSVCGITRRELYRYLDGLQHGYALEFESAHAIKSVMSLNTLRGIAGGFHPPQFFARIDSEHPLYSTVSSI